MRNDAGRDHWTARVAGLTALAVAVLAGTGLAWSGASSGPSLPSEIKLRGVVRDFRERTVTGGHTDFERKPTGGFGHYMGLVQDELDADGKPQFKSFGYKVTANWKDSAGRARMNPRSYIASKAGDSAGTLATTEGGAVTSASSLAQWFRDDASVNSSKQLELTLVRQGDTSVYTFNDKTDPNYSALGGFFPINNELFGNSAGGNKNFHFSFELDTKFVYKKDSGQVFTFTGDDDVWVFVDGKLVIDIGGVHGATSQTIDLDRLTWLEDGKEYSLKFFFVERHRTASNFRIDTTLQLKNAELPSTTALYD